MDLNINIVFCTPLHVIFQLPKPDLRAAVFTFQQEQHVSKGENMSNTMQIGTYATVSVEWKDQSGNVVKVDGPTKWDSSDDAICEVEVSAGNPQIANLYAPGPPIGTVQIQATADADLGEGVRAVTATTEVQVISGEAESGDITFTQSPSQGPQK